MERKGTQGLTSSQVQLEATDGSANGNLPVVIESVSKAGSWNAMPVRNTAVAVSASNSKHQMAEASLL